MNPTLEAWLTWTFSPTISAILVTLLISLLSPILFHYYLYTKAASKELPIFLLIGPSGAGKTSLLTLFANQTPSPTHTSQSPQTALCNLPTSIRTTADRYRSENDDSARAQPQILLNDTPGHGKLRHHALNNLSSSSSTTALKGILFVVDSAALSSAAGLTETAEFLHDVLLILQKRHTRGKTSKGPQAVPVCVAANKQDVFSSLPTAIVEKRLEVEIGKVREARSRGLVDSGVGGEGEDEDEEGNWLGEYGAKEFRFGQMEEHGVDVKIVGGNVKGDGNEAEVVDGWWSWIGQNV